MWIPFFFVRIYPCKAQKFVTHDIDMLWWLLLHRHRNSSLVGRARLNHTPQSTLWRVWLARELYTWQSRWCVKCRQFDDLWLLNHPWPSSSSCVQGQLARSVIMLSELSWWLREPWPPPPPPQSAGIADYIQIDMLFTCIALVSCGKLSAMHLLDKWQVLYSLQLGILHCFSTNLSLGIPLIIYYNYCNVTLP